jgi:hypothetical protein
MGDSIPPSSCGKPVMRAERMLRYVFAIVAGIAVAVPAVAAMDRISWNGFEDPIAVPTETWTWVDFPNAHCGNGSATGVGINPTTLSDRVLIYLEGGGACWDALTCYFLHAATNFTSGYGAAQFGVDVADTGALAQPGGFFDRSAAANPFKDYSYVYVPYCTGDAHAGSNVVALLGGTAHFVGFRNISAYLERLAVTFPAAGRIILAGSSAGGLGATLNWWQTQNAFPETRVDMINDSGAIMPEDVLPQPNATEQTQRTNWNLAATLPPGCTACATAFDVILSFYTDVFPDNRGALLTYNPDSVLPAFYGISSSKFSQGLGELETEQFDPTTNLHYFQTGNSGHELWFAPTTIVNGTSVQAFVTQMVTDDANWTSVKP